MAADMFLRIDSVKGEAEDADHPGEIEVLGWSWAASQTGTGASGGGLGAGRVQVQDLQVTKHVDASSPTLFNLCCKGEHIKSLDLTCRKAGGEALEYMVVHLEDLIITSIGLSGSGDTVTETVTIGFSKGGYTYKAQVAAGSGSPLGQCGWDLKQHVVYTPPDPS
jgi:type VI secretion system secreted protein Hcp